MDPAAAETEPRGERRPVTRVSREPDTAFLSCSVEPTLSVHFRLAAAAFYRFWPPGGLDRV